jgi:hypothetical protein
MLQQVRVRADGQTSWMFVLSKAGSSQDLAFCHHRGDAVKLPPAGWHLQAARLAPGYNGS